MKLNSRLLIFMAGIGLTLSVDASANTPPNTPTITEPHADGQVVNPEDVHMETTAFSDVDAGDFHSCSDWQIWRISPSEMVWSIACIGGVERVHCHLGDGVFGGSHAGRTSLLPNTNYQLRARHKDSSGDAATQWSAFATRLFATAPATAVFPMQTDDVASSPLPALTDVFNSPIVLPGGGTPPAVRVESADGQMLLEIGGADGQSNQIVNPPALAWHVDVRIRASAGGAGQGLVLPETNLSFTDDDSVPRVVYIPALNLSPGQEAYFWVSANGATYVGGASQTQPEFSMLARSAPVPWTSTQSGYVVERVAGGFQLPVNIAFVPNPGPNPTDPYFYITELYGTIKVVQRNGVVGTYASGLLNFTPTGAFPGSGEQGLSGIVVEPATGDVFAAYLYDSAPPSGNHYPKVVRFHSNNGGLTAASQSTVKDMSGETQGQSHQISNLSIGPDGKLYVHLGDGFDATKGQDLTSYRGKILRMNLSGTAATDNPFYNAGDGLTARDFVFAYGLRNPFGGAWRAADSTHYEVENGPSVDRFVKVVAGRNYLYNGSDASMANFAIYNWNPAHGPVNMAFIQPSTFGGSGFPAAKYDHMFISESGPTWGTGPQPLGKRIVEFVLDAGGGLVSGPTTLAEYNGSGRASCVGLTAGPDGLYFTDLYKDEDYTGPADAGANVLRVRFVGTASFTSDVTRGAAPLTVQFTDTSTVVGPTAWSWTFGDGGTSVDPNPSHVFNYEGNYNVRLAITTANGLMLHQESRYVRVGHIPSIALIGGTIPPSASDLSLADHLRNRGFDVTHYDDEPANRPPPATMASQNDLVMVSSSITASNVAGQFRQINVPLVFWEQGLLRTDREALASSGVAVAGSTAINVLVNSHPVTQGLPSGALTVFSSGSNMSVGQGTIAPNASLLATRSGSATDAAILTCDAAAVLLNGYVAPARRAFLFLEDSGWSNATASAQQILDQAVCWAMSNTAPSVSPPAVQIAYAGYPVTFSSTVTSTPPAEMQWRRNGNDLVDNGRFSGSTAPVLTINPVLASDAGDYQLVATSGCGSTTSAIATLTVRIKGDADCNGALELLDISAFVQALVDPAGYAAAYPSCPVANGDFNFDGNVDGGDVNGFVFVLLGV